MLSALRLPDNARPGRVRLRVAEAARALGFYRDLLGMEVVGEGEALVLAPRGGDALIELREVPGLRPRPARPVTAGLYHVALLLPDRAALGHALRSLRDAGYPLRGFADHAVSESVYLDDPDGNGLELYADRPRAAWQWHDGRVHMTVDPLDVDDLLAASEPLAGPFALPAAAVVGHVHFTVSDLPATTTFYRDVVGFDLVARLPGLVGVSAGGYHHHLNLNSWAGSGAPPDRPDVAGLDGWTLLVPDPRARAALLRRLDMAGALTGPATATDPDGVPLWLPEAPPGSSSA